MSDQQVRHLEVDALKALAHPLRVRIFSDLSSFGPATASTLAARLGESSGATSYHLRQLEKHGFVREDEQRGSARERWWERVPGPVDFGPEGGAPEGAREAEQLVETEFARLEDARFAEFWARRGSLEPEWAGAAQSGAANLVLAPEELEALGAEVYAVLDRYRGRPADGRRRVLVIFRGFPVFVPEETEDSGAAEDTDPAP